MDAEAILGAIVLILCGFGCGSLFFWVGSWAQKRKDPMHFYSGTTVDPKTISDVPAYNHDNARLWKQYSIPFWLCALCAFGSIWVEVLMKISIALLVVGCTLGSGWLVWKYSKIHAAYKIR